MTLSKIEKKTVEVLKNADYPLPPREITEKTQEKPSTIRGVCRNLIKKGVLYQPIPGYYAHLTPYGDDYVSPLKVHDLRLVAEVETLRKAVKRPDVEFMIGNAKTNYQFGKRHGKFSVTVSHDDGLDYHLLMRVLSRVKEDAERIFGKELVFNCSFHLNRDIKYLRLDDFQSITIGEVGGWFKRIYQKEDEVRVEVGIKDARLDELVDLVVSNFNQLGFNFAIRKSIQNIEKTVKEINRKVSDTQRFLDRVLGE